MIRGGAVQFLRYAWAIIALIAICCGCTKSADETANAIENEQMPQNKTKAETLEQEYEVEPIQGSEESVLHVLVVVDMSGSMSKTHFIVNEILQLTKGLSENSSALQVEYIGFDANGAELVLLEELDQKFSSKGETSVYNGMEKTKEWVDEHCSDTGRACVIVLSDLFSSRTETNSRYDQYAAKVEQEELEYWMKDWKQKEKEEKLDICFITWESLTKGEEKEKTYKFLEEQLETQGVTENVFENGYQVVIDEGMDNTFCLDTDEGLDVLERKAIKYCTEFVMGRIVGEKIDQWDEKKANKRKHYISCKSKDYCQMFLQISLPENTQRDALQITGIKEIGDGKSADPELIYANGIVEGQYMNLYCIKDLAEYNEIHIEPEECVVSVLGVKKKDFQLKAGKKKVEGSGQYEVKIEVVAERGCGSTEKKIRVEVLDKQGNVVGESEDIELDGSICGYVLKYRVERKPQEVRVYCLDDDGEWQFMQATKDIRGIDDVFGTE